MPPKRMTANPVKPARYRPGKPTAPDQSSSEEDFDSEASSAEDAVPQKPTAKKPSSDAPAIVSSALKKVDLNKRFEQSRKDEQARAAAEAALAAAEAKAEAEEEARKESSSEYTSEEEEESDQESEEEAPKKVLLRPTFIPKGKRNAAAVSTQDPEAATAKKAEDDARKKEESKQLLEEHLRRDIEAKAAGRKGWDDDDDATGIDDTDDLDPAAERAAWKLRELTRVKREREAIETIEKEREEIERRKNMDPELRRKEDMDFVAKQREEKKESRGQMGFLQKYYHKGAFYQDDSEILKKDYATAPIEDEVKNRDVLPKYMQMRGGDEVGKRGRTRWTHLTAEDTSTQNGGSPWFDKSSSNRRAAEKMGGMRGDERFMPDPKKDRERGGDDDWRQKREERNQGGDRFRDRDRGHGGDRERDFGDKQPPEGPRRDREGGGGGGGRYVPDGPRPNWDRGDRYGGDRDRHRSRSPPRRRDGGGGGGGGGDRDRDRERKRPRSPPRRQEEDDSGDGDKRRRTEVPVR